MLTYKWKKLYKETNGKARDIVNVIEMLTFQQRPRNFYDPMYKYWNTDFSGHNFLVSPETLLYNAYKYSYQQLATYIALASYRSLGEYLATGKITLDLIRSPVQHPEFFIKDTSLLNVDINNGVVHFCYERSHIEEKTQHGT